MGIRIQHVLPLLDVFFHRPVDIAPVFCETGAVAEDGIFQVFFSVEGADFNIKGKNRVGNIPVQIDNHLEKVSLDSVSPVQKVRQFLLLRRIEGPRCIHFAIRFML